MRHLNSGRKFGMDGSQRKAMLRNMVTSLMLHGRIRTTETRAKDLRRIADRLITLGKRIPPSDLALLEGEALAKARADRVHAIRQVRRWVNDDSALDKVFNEYAERFKARPGGYTRLSKVGFRAGDNAPMNIIELVSDDGAEVPSTTEQHAEAPAVEAGEGPAAAPVE